MANLSAHRQLEDGEVKGQEHGLWYIDCPHAVNHDKGRPCHRQWDYYTRVKRVYYGDEGCLVPTGRDVPKARCVIGQCGVTMSLSPATQWRHIKAHHRDNAVALNAASLYLEEDKRKKLAKKAQRRSAAQMNQDMVINFVPPHSTASPFPCPPISLPNLNSDVGSASSTDNAVGNETAPLPQPQPPQHSAPSNPLTLPTITDVHCNIDIGTFLGDLRLLRSQSSTATATEGLPTSIKEKLDYLVSRWILLRAKSFSVTAEKELLDLLHYFCPLYTPPNAQCIGTKWLDRIYKEVNVSVKKVCVCCTFYIL